MHTFTTAITNTLAVGLLVSVASALVGLLFAYVEVYVKLRTRFLSGLFKVVSMLPVVSPPFVLSLSVIMLFGKVSIITRYLLGIYDNSVYGFWGIFVVQTLTFFPVCYMMLRGLLKNIDPSLEEAARDMGASRWKVFTSVTLPLVLPGLGNAFLVTFIESIADFANPMIIGGSYDTLATTIYLRITGAYDKEGRRGDGRGAAVHHAAHVHRPEVRARGQEHGHAHRQGLARPHAHHRQVRDAAAHHPVRRHRPSSS